MSRVLVVVAVLAQLGSACAPAREPPLVVGSVRLPAVGLLYVAASSGCLERADPPVVVRDYVAGRDALAALRRGEIEAAVAFERPVVLNVLEDPSLRILTTLHTASRNTGLVARSDRGIRAVADLRGRRVALPMLTNAESFLRTLLTLDGVELSEVTLVDVAPGQAAAELASGRVDALAVWSPLLDEAAKALAPEQRALFFSDEYVETSMLVTRQATRVARRRPLAALVSCLAQAEQEVDGAGDGGHAIARHAFPEQDPSLLERQWDGVVHGVGLSNFLVSILEREAEGLRPAGTAPPHFRDVLAPEFLAQAAPDTVTVPEP